MSAADWTGGTPGQTLRALPGRVVTADVLEFRKMAQTGPITEYIYRYHDKPVLHYIGRTDNTTRRAKEHSGDDWSDLWSSFDREILTAPNSWVLECWEQVCIAVENPLQNKKRWKPESMPDYDHSWSGRLTPEQFYEWSAEPLRFSARERARPWWKRPSLIWYFRNPVRSKPFHNIAMLGVRTPIDTTEAEVRDEWFMGVADLAATFTYRSREHLEFADRHRVWPRVSLPFATLALEEHQKYTALFDGWILSDSRSERFDRPYNKPLVVGVVEGRQPCQRRWRDGWDANENPPALQLAA